MQNSLHALVVDEAQAVVRTLLYMQLHVYLYIFLEEKKFHRTFAEIGSIHSLIPNSVKILVQRHTSIKEFIQKLINGVNLKRVNMAKTTEFCWSFWNCTTF